MIDKQKIKKILFSKEKVLPVSEEELNFILEKNISFPSNKYLLIDGKAVNYENLKKLNFLRNNVIVKNLEEKTLKIIDDFLEKEEITMVIEPVFYIVNKILNSDFSNKKRKEFLFSYISKKDFTVIQNYIKKILKEYNESME